ncbi:MAG: Histidine kinase (modular protein) [Promethearchaeota archaeon]|nr:MAG: Histidine kinase (modular protein) [Candidatus Lokiarchaeota archaeon]
MHRKKDGTIFPVEITANHTTLEGQQVNISSIRDITEREKAEQELLESEKKYRELFNNINSGVAVYEAYRNGKDFIFKEFNLAASRIEDVKREDLIGKRVTEIFPGVKKFGIFKVFQRVWRTGEAEFQPVKLYKDERIKGWRESYIYKLPSGEIVAVYDEVSDRVIAQQKIKESEELFRSTFEQAAVGIAHLSPSGNFLRINQKLCDILKYSHDELLSLTFKDITHPSDIEDNLIASDNLLSGELSSYKTEKRYICGDGTCVWADLTVSVKRDKRGNPEYFISVIKDISKRKKAKQKLKESENKFRTIAEQASIGIAIFQKGNIKYFNQAYADIYEYDIDEINTWKINEMLRNIYIEDLPKIEGIIKQRKFDKVKTITYTTRINTKNGKIKWVEVFSREIIYQNEKAILVTTIDITDKKEIEKRLKELDKIKSEFISRTSHELKTPLVSIKGYVNLFLEMHSKDLNSQSISILKEINHGCDRLESLIKDLLETSRLETKGLELKKERENLGFLIKYSINDLLGLINQRKHNVAMELHENMNTMFEKERIYQVITNLLSNAINYTPPNGTLEIKSEIKDNHYVISIKDSGIGLTEDEKKKIFKKFGKIERYGQGFDVISEGTGLGLYISKKVIELHGGKIWVKSEGRNKGSTFSFSLPIVKN